MSSLRRLQFLRRQFGTTTLRGQPLRTGPSPPRLPEKDQKVFEELQKASTGAFSTPRPVLQQSGSSVSSKINQSPLNQGSDTQSAQSTLDTPAQLNATIQAKGDGEELHPDVRRGAVPEFEGDRNPKTGEVGGPKNDPLRWGGNADWSYNGRVTDF